MLADGIGCCIRMVVRREAPSSLRMIIRSIVEAARGPDNGKLSRASFERRLERLVGALRQTQRLLQHAISILALL